MCGGCSFCEAAMGRDLYEEGLEEYTRAVAEAEAAANEAGAEARDSWHQFDSECQELGDRASGCPTAAYAEAFEAIMAEARPQLQDMEMSFVGKGR